MKLASLKHGRDGTLIVVDRGLTRAVMAGEEFPTMQSALDDWGRAAPRLRETAERLEKGRVPGEFKLSPRRLAAPLPRAMQWADGSAYVNHVELVRRARGAEMPESFWHDPLMYQGGGDRMLGPTDDIVAADESWGVDFEGELAVVVDDTPAGVAPAAAAEKIILLGLLNDVSLRNLVPAELAKGFGFFQSKPPTAFAPVFVTPDELGGAWRDARVHLPLRVFLNRKLFGRAHAGTDMVFNFARLIAHAAKTRPLGAGAIIGGGTVSNQDASVGSSCIAEKRMLEVIADGKPSTPFLRHGDEVRMDMRDERGHDVFGELRQLVRIQ